jgi:hypothetical protein
MALRGKLVEVHETHDRVVRIRHDQTDLAATVFRKDGGVRQQTSRITSTWRRSCALSRPRSWNAIRTSFLP